MEKRLEEAIKDKDFDTIYDLLQQGLSINDTTKNDILLLAVQNNKYPLTKILIENYKADINMDNNRLLSTAIKHNYEEITNYILANESFNIINDEHYFLSLAVEYNDLNSAKRLFYCIEQKNTKQKENRLNDIYETLLRLIIKNKNIKIFDYLMERKKCTDTLNNEIISSLILKSIQSNDFTFSKKVITSFKNYFKQKNIPFTINSVVHETTPLIEAIKLENLDMVNYLVKELNADVNLTSSKGSPIAFSRKNKSSNIKYYLIKNGARCSKYEKLFGKILELNTNLKNKIFKLMPSSLKKIIKKYTFTDSDREYFTDKKSLSQNIQKDFNKK